MADEVQNEELDANGLVTPEEAAPDKPAEGGAEDEKAPEKQAEETKADDQQVKPEETKQDDDRFSKPLQKLQQELGNLKRQILRDEQARTAKTKDVLDDDDLDPYTVTKVIAKRVKAIEETIAQIDAAQKEKTAEIEAAQRASNQALFRAQFKAEHPGLDFDAVKEATRKAIEAEVKPFEGQHVSEELFRYIANKMWEQTVEKAEAALKAKPAVTKPVTTKKPEGTRIVDSASAAHRGGDSDDNGNPFEVEDRFANGLVTD